MRSAAACATTSLYAFIACAPFILADRLHVPTAQVGVYLALLVSGVWLGSLIASRTIRFFSLRNFLIAANSLSVVAAAAFLAIVLMDVMTLPRVIGTMFLFSAGVGAAAPAALVQAISVNPRVTGTASGLYGSVQMAVGAALAAAAGLGSSPALASALVLAASGVVAQLAFFIAAREPRGEPESAGGNEEPRDALIRQTGRLASSSRIWVRSTTSSLGFGGSAGFSGVLRFRLLMPLMTRNSATATIRKLITTVMKSP